MASGTRQNSQITAGSETQICPTRTLYIAPVNAVVMLVAGMAAAWIAAGSVGLIGNPLRHALTWLALAVAVVAAWPTKKLDLKTWAMLAVVAAMAIAFTAATSLVVNVLAVAVVMATIAWANDGLTARLALLGSLAAIALGCFRFACDSIPIVWHAADLAGWMLGRLAAWLSGGRLEIGATFGGLDFLVLTAVVYVGWLVYTPSPRRARAIWAAAAIVAGQLVYLVALARVDGLLALLPETIAPLEETNHVGVWTINNGLRTMIPWNMPLLAMVIQGAIVAAIVGMSKWSPAVGLRRTSDGERQDGTKDADVPGTTLLADMAIRFGPILLAVAAALLAGSAAAPANLGGKTIVVYDQGYMLDWLKPEYDSDDDGYYGLLPEFVQSLGGRLIRSETLSDGDLAKADALLIIHPDRPWPPERLERVWDYVRRGGSLLVAADQAVRQDGSRSSFNELLEPLSMRVRFDACSPRAACWEHSYRTLPHPTTLGLDESINPFGLQAGSSIATGWRARPLLAGRWGWSEPGSGGGESASYDPGERLGDLTLVAEQPFGKGRVVVIGETAPLQNEQLAGSYQFLGRLLGYVTARPSDSKSPWRQLAAFAAVAAMFALLACRPEAWQMIVAPSVFAVALIWSASAGYWSGRVTPDGRQRPLNNIAYIDASHLESYAGDIWAEKGMAGLLRALMRHGYIPLFAPDLQHDRLERCGLLISIGPQRKFTLAERKEIAEFVDSGGAVICMVGAEQAQPSAALLESYGIRVPHSPVPPGDAAREPAPLGACSILPRDGMEPFLFYAAWPVETTGDEADSFLALPDEEWSFAAMSQKGAGRFVVIGDTLAAVNWDMELAQPSSPETISFWRWVLSRAIPGHPPWNPPSTNRQNDERDEN